MLILVKKEDEMAEYSSMDSTFAKKAQKLKDLLAGKSREAMYETLIALGKELPPYPEERKLPEHLVSGCQSTVYLYATLKEGSLFFTATSDALLSAGLAALLLSLYNGESPKTVLTCTPQVLEELQIARSLSPTRSNGLANIHVHMKQEAVKFLLQR